MAVKKLLNPFIWCVPALFGIISCTRDTIEFGTVPENNYTTLSYIDTLGVQLSTVLTDSFATGNATSFLLGKYKDPYLGVVKASPFFQLTQPAAIPNIPSNALYDSLTFIIRLNKYYYGDTSRQQTISVNELDQTITTGYGNNLYNTSTFPVKPVPLGAKMLRIRPSVDDSISIRLNDSKGVELFSKLKNLAEEVTSSDAFQNYFKGISLTTGIADTSAIFGLLGSADSNIVMRVNYHTTIPYASPQFIDFPLLPGVYNFDQILTDRSGTAIVSANNTSGISEIPTSQTNGYAFSQPGTGLKIKMIFPSLSGILRSDNYVKLLKAELIVRPASLSFDDAEYKLPDKLYLAYTNGSNVVGNSLPDSTGTNTLYAAPVIDEIYGQNNYYQFNITSFISQLLSVPGSSDSGLYLMQDFTPSAPQVTRLIMGGNGIHNNYITQLQLYVVSVKK